MVAGRPCRSPTSRRAHAEAALLGLRRLVAEANGLGHTAGAFDFVAAEADGFDVPTGTIDAELTAAPHTGPLSKEPRVARAVNTQERAPTLHEPSLQDLLRAQLDTLDESIGELRRRSLPDNYALTIDTELLDQGLLDDLNLQDDWRRHSMPLLNKSSAINPSDSEFTSRIADCASYEGASLSTSSSGRASLYESVADNPAQHVAIADWRRQLAVENIKRAKSAPRDVEKDPCHRCKVLSLQANALIQALAGLGARCFNWSCSLGKNRQGEVAAFVKEYVQPCSHLDASLESLCVDLEKAVLLQASVAKEEAWRNVVDADKSRMADEARRVLLEEQVACLNASEEDAHKKAREVEEALKAEEVRRKKAEEQLARMILEKDEMPRAAAEAEVLLEPRDMLTSRERVLGDAGPSTPRRARKPPNRGSVSTASDVSTRTHDQSLSSQPLSSEADSSDHSFHGGIGTPRTVPISQPFRAPLGGSASSVGPRSPRAPFNLSPKAAAAASAVAAAMFAAPTASQPALAKPSRIQPPEAPVISQSAAHNGSGNAGDSDSDCASVADSIRSTSLVGQAEADAAGGADSAAGGARVPLRRPSDRLQHCSSKSTRVSVSRSLAGVGTLTLSAESGFRERPPSETEEDVAQEATHCSEVSDVGSISEDQLARNSCSLDDNSGRALDSVIEASGNEAFAQRGPIDSELKRHRFLARLARGFDESYDDALEEQAVDEVRSEETKSNVGNTWFADLLGQQPSMRRSQRKPAPCYSSEEKVSSEDTRVRTSSCAAWEAERVRYEF